MCVNQNKLYHNYIKLESELNFQEIYVIINNITRYSLTCAVTCPLIALVNLLPESPFYHLMKNNEIKAKDSLKWYRGQTYEDIEIEELKYLVSHSGKVKRSIFQRR